MDVGFLGLVMALVKRIPGSATATAVQAKTDAQAAAALAQEYGYYLDFGDDETITVGSEVEEEVDNG